VLGDGFAISILLAKPIGVTVERVVQPGPIEDGFGLIGQLCK